MKRTTKDSLQTLANICNNRVPQNGWKFSIEYAYGRPRLILEDEKLCCRDVSPRLPKGQLVMWIGAFLDGIDIAKVPSNAVQLKSALELAEATIERLQRHAPESANGTLDVIRDAIAKG